MADCVLGLQRQGTACGNLGFRHQGLVNQHVTDGADVRIGVDLGVNRLLLRQFAGFGQVVHDLVDVRRDGLRNLEAQTEAHAVDVVRAEVLHRVFTGERLVGGFHADCPPSTGTLGVVGEDGEEDVRVESLGFRVGGQVHDVVRKIRDAEITVQLIERG